MAPGPQRATALWVIARIRTYEAPDEAAELFLQVVEEAEDDGGYSRAAHEGVASCRFYALERLGECASTCGHGARARPRARRRGT